MFTENVKIKEHSKDNPLNLENREKDLRKELLSCCLLVTLFKLDCGQNHLNLMQDKDKNQTKCEYATTKLYFMFMAAAVSQRVHWASDPERHM